MSREYLRVCRFCGKEFIAHSPKAEVCKDDHTSVCCVCGKEFLINKASTYVSPTCSRKCGQQLGNESRKQTALRKYGVENVLQVDSVKSKCRDTWMQKYGVDNPSKSPDIQKKISGTFQANYGVNNPMQLDTVKNRLFETMKLRYGVKSAIQNTELRHKIEATNMLRYGSPSIFGSTEIRNKILDEREIRTGYRYISSNPEIKRRITESCLKKYGVAWNCMRPECRSASRQSISKINRAFADLLERNRIRFSMEYPIWGFSYDFYLPEFSTLIEINPTITHNSQISIFCNSKPIDPLYHSKKTHAAHRNNLHCIHVWDWDDYNKIISRFLICDVVYARDCSIKLIDPVVAHDFIQRNHMISSDIAELNYGLYNNGVLIFVMSFRRLHEGDYEFELLRFCSLTGYRVIGGVSKLFHAFLQDHDDVSVITYCDRSKFYGNTYKILDMKYVETTPPRKVWSLNSLHLYQDELDDCGSTDDELISDGWLPVYDCGQYVFVYDRT